MRWGLFLILLLCSLTALPQALEKPVLVYGEVLTDNNTPLNSAHIKDLSKNGKATMTAEDGSFSLLIGSLPAILEVSYVGYKTQAVSIGKKDLDKGGEKIQLTITLVLDSVTLPAIPVRPEEKVETVFDPYKAYLFDYIFMNGELLLLVSEGGYRRLQLLDESNQTLIKQPIGQAVFEFKEDCLGNYHLLGEDSAYQVIKDGDVFVLFAGILRKTMEEKIKPCITCKEETCILKAYKDHNQTEIFYKTNLQGNPTDSIFSVTDKATKKFTETAYASILAQAGIDTRFCTDVDLNKINATRQLEQEIWFYQKILRKPIFCTLLPVNNKFYLFDHVNNELVAFDQKANLESQINSTYNEKKKAGLKEVIVNQEETRAFALFTRGGITSLDEINLDDGSVASSYTLTEHRFPEKVKVKGKYAYYLYKDLGYDDKYRLFRQRLN